MGPTGNHQWPGHQGAGIAGPAVLNRNLVQVHLVFLDHHVLTGRRPQHLRTHAHHLPEQRQFFDGIAETLGRIRFLEKREELTDVPQRCDVILPHAQRYPLRCPEQVGQHRHVIALGIFKQQRRTTCSQGAVADLGHFQVGVDLNADPFQLAQLFQLVNEVSQVVVFHRVLRSDMPVLRRSLFAGLLFSELEQGGDLLSQTRREPIPGGLVLPSMARHSLGKQVPTSFSRSPVIHKAL